MALFDFLFRKKKENIIVEPINKPNKEILISKEENVQEIEQPLECQKSIEFSGLSKSRLESHFGRS